MVISIGENIDTLSNMTIMSPIDKGTIKRNKEIKQRKKKAHSKKRIMHKNEWERGTCFKGFKRDFVGLHIGFSSSTLAHITTFGEHEYQQLITVMIKRKLMVNNANQLFHKP